MSGEESSNICVKMSRAKVKSLKKNPGKKHLPGWLSIKTYQKIPLKYKYLVTLVLLSVKLQTDFLLTGNNWVKRWKKCGSSQQHSVGNNTNKLYTIMLPIRCYVWSNIELLSDVSPGFRKPFCERMFEADNESAVGVWAFIMRQVFGAL